MKRLARLRNGILLLCLLLGFGALASCEPTRSEGERLYRKHCANCHGNNAAGNTPRFMGNPWADLTDDYWEIGGDRVGLETAIREGVGEMPAFEELSDKEVRQIIDYLRDLRGESR